MIQASLGVVFALLFRSGIRSAGHWGVAYLLSAAAIAVYILPVDGTVLTLVSDGLFLASYFMFGEAIIARFGVPPHRPLRLALGVGVFLADIYVVVGLESLGASVLVVDLGISLQLATACALSWRHMLRGIDLVIGLLALLSVFSNAGMALLFGVLLPPGEDVAQFLASNYAFVMQLLASAFSLWFGLAGLAAITLDMLGKYRQAAHHDPLTGLLNRRGFEVAARRVRGAEGKGVLLILDLDGFKSINDQFGHDTGDLVLAGQASLLRAMLPPQAVIARFGGEEFVALLPGVSLAEGGALADSVRLACAGRDWRQLGVDRAVTLCAGVSAYGPDDVSLRHALRCADTALYAAKAAGRNRVMLGRDGAVEPVGGGAA
ncbi:hypothetical protein VW29_12760 [Devosia limi DSM 17137]|uniref:diguanylate cyclase n=1 Tax=Devosia limi DSM 17137 TaxID=1121477 RepID=A0A0F5LQM8_9HYPH|nr:hypothetical protein VW29_12760 [Devosia limi DSM 17137]